MASSNLQQLDAEATSYVEAHALEDRLSAAVDEAIRKRASDPLAFIANYLLQCLGGAAANGGGAAAGGARRPQQGRASIHAALHTKARSQENPEYPQRLPVSDECCRWSVPWPDYKPEEWTHKVVLANDRELSTGHKWADPPDVRKLRKELEERTTFSTEGGVGSCLRGAIEFDSEGRPQNPVGRTGLVGRGLLGKWGPNHAADPIVTRFHPETRQLQVVVIQRKDNFQWAIPGGMVDAGETVSVAIKREFTEETGNLESEADRQQFGEMVNRVFAGGQQVYRGYVDDPRATDNAWMETTAFHFHCPREVGDRLPLAAGDDAGKVMWLDVSTENPTYRELYGAHRALIDEAIFSAWGRGDLTAALVQRS